MSRTRKILIIEENSSVPFDPRVWNEACSLIKHGYDVIVLCPYDSRYGRRHEVLNGVHIYRYPTPKERSGLVGYLSEYLSAIIWQSLYAWWICMRHGFNAIQVCNPPDDIFLVALPFKLFGIKYIFDHHDSSPDLYLAKYGREGFLFKVQ